VADLVTHVLSAQWVATARGRLLPRPALVLGTMLPDYVANGPIVALRVVEPFLPWRLPLWLPDALTGFHAPILYALLCWWLAALVPRARRDGVFGALFLGGLLHIAIDLLQDHVAPGAYYPAYPLWRHPWHLGVLHNEGSLLLMPLFAAATLVVAWPGWRRALAARLAGRAAEDTRAAAEAVDL